MNQAEDDEGDLASIVHRSKLRRDFLAQSKLEIDSFALEIAAETTKAKENLRRQLSSSGDGFGERAEQAVSGAAGGGVSARTKKLWDFGSSSDDANANPHGEEEDVRESREESSRRDNGRGKDSPSGAELSAVDNGRVGSSGSVAGKDDEDSQARDHSADDSISSLPSLHRTGTRDSRRAHHQTGQLRYSRDQNKRHQDPANEDDSDSVSSSYSDIAASLRREMRQVITQQAKLDMEQLTLDADEMRKRVQHFRPVLKGDDGMRVVVDSTTAGDVSAPKQTSGSCKDGGAGQSLVGNARADTAKSNSGQESANFAQSSVAAKASAKEISSPKETNNCVISEWKKKVSRLLNQDDEERATKRMSDRPQQHDKEEDGEEYMGIELRLTQTYSEDEENGSTKMNHGANKNYPTSFNSDFKNFYSSQEEELPMDEEVHGPDSQLRRRRQELFKATGNSDIDSIIQKFQTARMKHSVEAQNINKFHRRPTPSPPTDTTDSDDKGKKWKKSGYRGINEDDDLISTGSAPCGIHKSGLDEHASPRNLRIQRVKDMKHQTVAPSPGAHIVETEKAATRHRKHGSDDGNKTNGEMQKDVPGLNKSNYFNPYVTPTEDETDAHDGVKTFGGKLNQWWRRQKGIKNFDEKNGLTDEFDESDSNKQGNSCPRHQSRKESDEKHDGDEEDHTKSSPIPAPLLIPSLLPSSPPSRHDDSDDRREGPPQSSEERKATLNSNIASKKPTISASPSGPLGLPPPSPRSSRIRNKSIVGKATNNNLSCLTSNKKSIQAGGTNTAAEKTDDSSGKRSNIFRRGPPCPEGNSHSSSTMQRAAKAAAAPPQSEAVATTTVTATPSPVEQPTTAPIDQESRSPPLTTIIGSTHHERVGSINSSASNLSEDQSQAGNNSLSGSHVSSLEPQSVAQSALEVILGRIEEAKSNFQKALVEDNVEKQTEMAALIAKLGEAAVAMRKLEQL